MKKPYVSQVDEMDCGVAALATVLKCYGTEKSIASLRLLAGTTKEGTTVLGIYSAAQRLGFDVKSVQAKSEIFQREGVPFPCIVHVIKENKYSHYYVIYEVNGDELLIGNPDPMEKVHKMSLKDFEQEWTGVAIFLVPNADFKPSKEKKESLFSYRKIIFQQQKLISVIVIFSFLVTIINILGTFFLQQMIDAYIPYQMLGTLQMMVIVLVIAYLIQQSFSFIENYFEAVFGQKLATKIILPYVKHIFELPISFFATRRIGEITSRFSDASVILDTLASVIISVFLDLTMVVLSGIVLGLQNSQLFLLALISIPIYAVIIFIFYHFFERQNNEAMQANSMMNSSIIERISGIETVKSLGNEEESYQQIEAEIRNYLAKTLKLQKNSALQASLKGAVQLVLNVVILWLGAEMVMRHQLMLGQLITFTALLSFFIEPLTNIINLQTKLQQAKVANRRLNEVYLVESEFAKEKQRKKMTGYALEMQDVTYRYGFSEPILQGINFKIEENEKIAIIGSSGSGKTTLVKLLVRFFEQNEGKVFLGHSDVSELDKRQIREIVHYLPQQPALFTGTILENLKMGAAGFSEQALVEACQRARILDVIEALPLGFDTQISGESTALSGGQKQRLALARALLTPAKVLILDEATSNLDVMIEREILDELFKIDRTIIFVAHRLTIAEQADKVLVIEKGRISAFEAPESLRNKAGLFSQLLAAQYCLT